jgi:hypothetical protein
MNFVAPWAQLMALIRHHAPVCQTRYHPFAMETLLNIHIVQQLCVLSNLAMEEVMLTLHYDPNCIARHSNVAHGRIHSHLVVSDKLRVVILN